MRDITDYFKSSTNDINTTKSPTEHSKETSKNESKISPNTPKSKRFQSKRTPRSKKKISPRTSPLEGFNILFKAAKNQSAEKYVKNSKMENQTTKEIAEAKCSDGDNSFEIKESSENPIINNTKLNAFQLLMMSRNKVIGSNSPGKELPEQEVTSFTSPPRLLARKRLLQTWSDSLEAKKRKLNDDEINKCIKVKLNTRKDRLKSLLHIDDSSEDATKQTPEPKTKNHSSKTTETMMEKKTANISQIKNIPNGTEQEEKMELAKPDNMVTINVSGDDFEIKVQNTKEINTPKTTRKKPKKNSKGTPKSSSTPKSAQTWKMKIKLVDHDLDCSSNINKADDRNDIIILEDSENSIKELTENRIECQNEIINTGSLDTPKIDLKIQEENDCGRVLRSRTGLKNNKNRSIDYVYYSDNSDDEVKKINHKAVKVAPVFAKAMPKPKIDPEVLEARRKFLLSDMPDTLKKKVEKQTSTEHIDIDFDVFPKMSHVYQEEKNNPLWNLPDANLETKTTTPFSYEPSELLCQSLIDNTVIKPSRYKESEPIKNTKTIMRDMKLENTNYPVYRAFRLLNEKNGFKSQAVTKTTPKRGRKPRHSSEKKVETIENTDSQDSLKHLMWTEKYKPRSSEDFFGNIHAVSAIKKWLQMWKEVLESGRKKRKQFSSDSDSEFMSSDAESVYDRSLSTTIVLTGPCGSGKSSSVYAVCNELGLNVLELNASSRRTGKQIIQELQEATRSHQVRKNKDALDSFTNKGIPSKPIKDVEKNKSKKMCLLLIEDIDIVFEQDEGFINAITQISATSKRPIVLTTTNEDSIYAQKFMNDFKTIRFHSLSVKNLGIWLQILCLLEGIFVDLSSIGELLEYNRGDLRKTILELQYWIQSGGQISKHKTLLDPIFELESLNDESCLTPLFDDTQIISLKEYDVKLDEYRMHSNILSDFETFQVERFYNIPPKIDLKALWWNIPKFLNPSKPKHKKESPNMLTKKNRKKFKMVSDMYDSVAGFDVSYRKMGYKCDDPVCRKRWHCELQDSLEVEEKSSGFSINQDILELNHYLIDGYLNSCKKKFIYEFSENQRLCNMAVPGLDKTRKLNNDHKYEEELLNPVPSLNTLDRKSVVLDYLPCLRTIARTENIRAKNNVKRHNRFHNYLQNLNITCDTPIIDFAIQTFTTNNFSQ